MPTSVLGTRACSRHTPRVGVQPGAWRLRPSLTGPSTTLVYRPRRGSASRSCSGRRPLPSCYARPSKLHLLLVTNFGEGTGCPGAFGHGAAILVAFRSPAGSASCHPPSRRPHPSGGRRPSAFLAHTSKKNTGGSCVVSFLDWPCFTRSAGEPIPGAHFRVPPEPSVPDGPSGASQGPRPGRGGRIPRPRALGRRDGKWSPGQSRGPARSWRSEAVPQGPKALMAVQDTPSGPFGTSVEGNPERSIRIHRPGPGDRRRCRPRSLLRVGGSYPDLAVPRPTVTDRPSPGGG